MYLLPTTSRLLTSALLLLTGLPSPSLVGAIPGTTLTKTSTVKTTKLSPTRTITLTNPVKTITSIHTIKINPRHHEPSQTEVASLVARDIEAAQIPPNGNKTTITITTKKRTTRITTVTPLLPDGSPVTGPLNTIIITNPLTTKKTTRTSWSSTQGEQLQTNSPYVPPIPKNPKLIPVDSDNYDSDDEDKDDIITDPRPANQDYSYLEHELPRLIIYFQTTHEYSSTKKQPKPISMLPLITKSKIALTHLIVCSLHVNPNMTIHLNDHPPDHPRFYTLWNETNVLRAAGIKVMGMVGGAAAGSFTHQTLDAPDGSLVWEKAYSLLRDTIYTYDLQGLDIDIEQPMSLFGICRLVRRLRHDFGNEFIISLSPVATALQKRSARASNGNLSGFSYHALDNIVGHLISFYQAQFYNGWGDLSSPRGYENIIYSSGLDPKRIVAGQLTTPDNGSGWVNFNTLNSTITSLRATFGQIGGIMGWEYFNGAPGGAEEPWRWAQIVTEILRPGLLKELKVTRAIAESLNAAWRDSILGSLPGSQFLNAASLGGAQDDFDESLLIPDVDYMGMINA